MKNLPISAQFRFFSAESFSPVRLGHTLTNREPAIGKKHSLLGCKEYIIMVHEDDLLLSFVKDNFLCYVWDCCSHGDCASLEPLL